MCTSLSKQASLCPGQLLPAREQVKRCTRGSILLFSEVRTPDVNGESPWRAEEPFSKLLEDCCACSDPTRLARTIWASSRGRFLRALDRQTKGAARGMLPDDLARETTNAMNACFRLIRGWSVQDNNCALSSMLQCSYDLHRKTVILSIPTTRC